MTCLLTSLFSLFLIQDVYAQVQVSTTDITKTSASYLDIVTPSGTVANTSIKLEVNATHQMPPGVIYYAVFSETDADYGSNAALAEKGNTQGLFSNVLYKSGNTYSGTMASPGLGTYKIIFKGYFGNEEYFKVRTFTVGTVSSGGSSGGKIEIPATSFNSVTVSPSAPKSTDKIKIAWTATNASFCTFDKAEVSVLQAKIACMDSYTCPNTYTEIGPLPAKSTPYQYKLMCTGFASGPAYVDVPVMVTASAEKTTSANDQSLSQPTTQISSSEPLAVAADASTVGWGKTATIRWVAKDATKCSAAYNSLPISGMSGTVQTPKLYATTVYTITCTGGSTSYTKSVRIEVESPKKPTVSFSATPDTVEKGGVSSVAWSSTDAEFCSSADGKLSILGRTEGTLSTGEITEDTKYLIACTGEGGQTKLEIEVKVKESVSLPVDNKEPSAVVQLFSTHEMYKSNDDTTTFDDQGRFVIRFDVTAVESNLWINKTATRDTRGSGGAHYSIVDGDGKQVTSGTSTASLSSMANTDGTRFKVNEGETETFTLTVEFDPNDSGIYGVQLEGINFAPTNVNPTTQERLQGMRTDLLMIESGKSVKEVTPVAETPSVPELVLTVDPASVTSGEASKISWTSTHTDLCSIQGNLSSKDADTHDVTGSVTSRLLRNDSTFTVSCTGKGGTISKEVTVTVVKKNEVEKIEMKLEEKSTPSTKVENEEKAPVVTAPTETKEEVTKAAPVEDVKKTEPETSQDSRNSQESSSKGKTSEANAEEESDVRVSGTPKFELVKKSTLALSDNLIRATYSIKVLAKDGDVEIADDGSGGGTFLVSLVDSKKQKTVVSAEVSDEVTLESSSYANAVAKNGSWIIPKGGHAVFVVKKSFTTENLAAGKYYASFSYKLSDNETPLLKGKTKTVTLKNLNTNRTKKDESVKENSESTVKKIVEPSDARTYYGYMYHKGTFTPFIVLRNISEEDALNNCKLNAAARRGRTVRCTWEGKEIFNNGSGEQSSYIAAPMPLASASYGGVHVGILPLVLGDALLVLHTARTELLEGEDAVSDETVWALNGLRKEL